MHFKESQVGKLVEMFICAVGEILIIFENANCKM